MQTDIEQADAKKVDQALDLLRNRNTSEAAAILRDVCSRCPDEYSYEFTADGTRYIKFWTMEEFLAYVAVHGQEENERVVWLLSAYPRACYYLAFALVEEHNFMGAIGWLNKGRLMEPRNPRFLLELGVAHAHMKEHQTSYDCYEEACGFADGSKHDRAIALRGMGVQLIELGRLDEAEGCLKKSLTVEADNSLAKHELAYIDQLRAGQKARQIGLRRT